MLFAFCLQSLWAQNNLKVAVKDSATLSPLQSVTITVKESKIKTLPLVVDQLAKKLSLSQAKNFVKWNILNQKVYRELQVAGSYEAEVKLLKNYLVNRINWLDTKFNSDEYR